MSEREAIAQIIFEGECHGATCKETSDRIIAEHILPLRKDRDEWRQANLGIVRKCAEAEQALVKAEADRDMARKARAVYARECRRLLDCTETLEALLTVEQDFHRRVDEAFQLTACISQPEEIPGLWQNWATQRMRADAAEALLAECEIVTEAMLDAFAKACYEDYANLSAQEFHNIRIGLEAALKARRRPV